MDRSRPVVTDALSPRQLLEHALLLIARRHGGDAAMARSAEESFTAWRAAAPAHEAAAQAALRAWAATDASGLQDSVPLPMTQAARTRQSRRRVLSVLGLAGLAAGLVGGMRSYWMQALQELALHTSRAQMLAHTLEDGSRIDLGPHTRLQARWFRDRREVRLAQGEARFEVAPDAQRPFTVVTAVGRVRVLGTVFTVAVRGSDMTVAVAHGRVAVWSTGDADTPPSPPDVELSAGQTVQVQDGRLGAVGSVSGHDVGAWRQGWLVFDRTPLPEAVARWNDYLAQPLTLSDEPALQALKLTGSFPLRDPSAFVASLPAVLPVRVDHPAHQGPHIRLRH